MYLDEAERCPLFERICSELYQSGYCVIENTIPPNVIRELTRFVHQTEEKKFRQAGIGRNNNHERNTSIRKDSIFWITDDMEAAVGWLDWIDRLKKYMNRRLLLGLHSFESHFAWYREGCYYKKHLDAFCGEKNRKVSLVLYLNANWHPDEGGEFVLYSHNTENEITRVLPQLGTLVLFLSEEFPHEVLPASRQRFSVAGWFRVNASSTERVDPPV